MNLIIILSLFLIFINTQTILNNEDNSQNLIQPRIKLGSESEAKQYIHYAMASYCQDKSITEWNCKPYCKGNSSQIQVKPFSNIFLNMTGYLAINDNEKQIIISFRGSSNTINWITNINTLYSPIFVDNKFMLVHSGFWWNTVSVYQQVKSLLLEARAKRPNYKVLLTGHSLGGAVAGLIIPLLRRDNIVKWSDIKLITYAAPRIGDAGLMDYFNSKDFVSVRAFNPMDIVPNLPPDPLFRHFEYPLLAGPLSLDGKNCGVEVMLDLVKCLLLNDKLDFNHKFFWGEYYPSGCI